MGFKNSKVAIVGVGNVGATTAYTIVNQGLCEEIVLIDVNKDKAYAEALDMQHSIYFMNRNIQVKAGDYSDCRMRISLLSRRLHRCRRILMIA